ncbi:hypothetical protein [Nitrosomonas sp. Nm34]|uniref:hypothetical protein n=1 Tax=Nitrosomonas sp. Nm34 TaxID=1881055 RepID=UPI0008EFAB3E|nr:hypothetical protein [Nitrosomonas sp. Nm34]SFI91080.1 hypothetical protein SAMN05428978_105623 [Nitrosomonas sp. Nm34]
MSKKRIQYSSEFKAKLALAAIRGNETFPQLAAQINSWKRQLIEQATELFSKNNTAGNKEQPTTTYNR